MKEMKEVKGCWLWRLNSSTRNIVTKQFNSKEEALNWLKRFGKYDPEYDKYSIV